MTANDIYVWLWKKTFDIIPAREKCIVYIDRFSFLFYIVLFHFDSSAVGTIFTLISHADIR